VHAEEEDKLISRLKDPKTINDAFGSLVSLYQERIYWHIRRIVVTHEDANDVVQNTFIKAYKGMHRFRAGARLYTWLYRIATNESLTFLKSAKRTASGELVATINLQADVFFDGSEAELLLQKAIASLPDKQRIVFNMKYYEDMTYKEMSEILETSVGALKASYHHAVKKIEGYVKRVQI